MRGGAGVTLSQLNEYRALVLKLYNAQELIDRLRSKALPQSPQITGLPHGSYVTDVVGMAAAEIADLEDRCAQLRIEIEARSDIVKWITDIPDNLIRTVFRLRFLRALCWKDVAECIGGNTEDSVKAAAYRYLASCHAMSPDDAP